MKIMIKNYIFFIFLAAIFFLVIPVDSFSQQKHDVQYNAHARARSNSSEFSFNVYFTIKDCPGTLQKDAKKNCLEKAKSIAHEELSNALLKKDPNAKILVNTIRVE